MADNSGENLPSIFCKILTIYENVENSELSSNSTDYQLLLKNGAELSEKGIHMVNTLNVFSSNEEVEELSANEIRYLILPALLAYFTYRKSDGDKLDTIKLAEFFYGDFFKLCSNYSIPNIPENPMLATRSGSVVQSMVSVEAMKEERTSKIQRYKEQKSLSCRLTELRSYVDQEHVDEEVKREYYLTLVQKWAYLAYDEVDTIKKELPLLEMMKKGPKPDIRPVQAQGNFKSAQRPFILTRNAMEARVFGAGYPSLHTYSVEEYCDMQIEQGLLPSNGGPTATVHRGGDSGTNAGEEGKAAADDDKEDQDDEEQLAQRRNWDDFKDDNRRGHGNRMNRFDYYSLAQVMSKSNKIQYVQNDEPNFIKQFKQKAGMKDPESVDSKFDEREVDDREDREDERPQIVIPEGSTVTQEEMDKFMDNGADSKKEDEPAVSTDGKILFRQPGLNKRKSTEPVVDGKSPVTGNGEKNETLAGSKKCRKTKKEPPKTSMLSFSHEEEEEEEVS